MGGTIGRGGTSPRQHGMRYKGCQYNSTGSGAAGMSTASREDLKDNWNPGTKNLKCQDSGLDCILGECMKII